MILATFTLLNITSISSQTAGVRCFFEVHFYNYYSCVVSEANVTSDQVSIDFITGEHTDDRVDNEVEEITNIDSNEKCENCTFRVLTRHIMEKFPKLKKIWLSYVGMERISLEAFASCEELSELNLDANQLISIVSGTFEKCAKLTHLSLEDNQFGILTSEMFQGLVNLEKIELQGNLLTTLSASAFQNLKTLKQINLVNNQLGNLSLDLFKENTLLEELFLMFCGLNEISSQNFLTLTHLKILFLDKNLIEELPNGIFSELENIEHIFIHFNKIKQLNTDSFGQLEKLDTIYITNNNLNEIQPNFFEKLITLKYFIAQGNVCILENVYNMDGFNFTLNAFEDCFENWNGASTLRTISFFIMTLTSMLMKFVF